MFEKRHDDRGPRRVMILVAAWTVVFGMILLIMM